MTNEFILRQLRKGYEAGIDLSAYMEYGVSTMREIRQAELENIDITGYARAGYDHVQLHAIRRALSKHLDIDLYLSPEYHGDAIMEIVIGLEHNIDVTPYARLCYTWRKMREIRLGLEHKVDIYEYANPRYSYWQMKEIRLGLEKGLDVSLYKNLMYTAKTMKRKRMELLSQKKEKSYSYKQISFEYGSLYISPDEMKAEIQVMDCSWKPDSMAVRELLLSCGIVEGYDELAIISLESGVNIYGRRIQIARGKNCVNGQDGYYTFNFAQRDEQDEIPDYGKACCVERVLKGQTLATYYSATAGENGKTITGRTIYAYGGKEMPKLWGSNIKILEDGRTYMSEINGRVMLKGQNMWVEELELFNDYKWDKRIFNFQGTVHISGDVPEGVKIYAGGDIIVDGMVTGATLTSERNILVRLGINKGMDTARLNAKENITVKYSEYAEIRAGKNIFLNYSLNSILNAGEAVVTFGNKGGIIGGSAFAERGYCISCLGNDNGRNTVIAFGLSEELKKNMIKTENALKTATRELENLKDALKKLSHSPDISNKDNQAFMYRLVNTVQNAMKKIVQLEEDRDLLNERMTKAVRAQVVVSDCIYDNVTFVCDGFKYSPNKLKHVSVKYMSGTFQINSLNL
ncbi:MAG: DUF342 domain-containing protein [Lachnospiraceae bacterium]